MKTVIFAGGLGTRISEESVLKPKPMIEIGGKPIIWHIMKIYAAQGFHDFVVCLGYKGEIIKDYFLNYYMNNSDLTVHIGSNKVEVHQENSENFNITLVDTGLHTNTAGRLKRVQQYVGNEPFMLTYGDGVADIDLHKLIAFHKSGGKLATLTSVRNASRFGELDTDEQHVVKSFREKSENDLSWINGGFFVLEPGVFKYLEGDMTDVQWERKPLTDIAHAGQLTAYQHTGFWKCMDALRDKTELEELWNSGNAKWKNW